MKIEHGLITPNYFTKSSADRKNTVIYGYASVFEIPDLDNDIVVKEAFKNVDPRRIKFLWQHDHSKPIGKVLTAEVDSYGLKIEAEINNSSMFGAEASALIKQKAVEGLSIGFRTKSCGYDSRGCRVINDIELFEISIVTFPANSKAQIHDFKSKKFRDRSIATFAYNKDAIEGSVQDANYSVFKASEDFDQDAIAPSNSKLGLLKSDNMECCPDQGMRLQIDQQIKMDKKSQNIEGTIDMETQDVETKMNTSKQIVSKLSKVDNLEERLRNIENLFCDSSDISKFSRVSVKQNCKNINTKDIEDFLRKGALPLDAEYKSFSTDAGAAGAVIKPELNNKILSFMEAKSPMRHLASIDNISGSSIDYVIEDGNMASGWVKESLARNGTETSKLVKHNILTHELYAEPKATQKLLDDSEIDIESWIAARIANRFVAAENEAFIVGDGDDKPFGLLVSDKIKILKAGGGDFKADLFLELISALPEQYLSGATFLMNRLTLSRIQSLLDSSGRFIWQHSMSDPLKQTIFGIPVVCVSEIPKIGEGRVHIVLGDISSTYKIIDRSDIAIMRDPYTEKPFVKFYATKRTGGDVINPDACRFLSISN